MNRTSCTAVVGLVVSASLLLSPAVARAQRPHDGAGGRNDPPMNGQPIASRPAPSAPPTPAPPALGMRRPFPPGPPFPRHVRPHAAPAIVYAVPPPLYYSGAGIRYGPPIAYDPAPTYAPGANDPAPLYGAPASSVLEVAPPPPPPSARVIEYPTGRYELQGDGATTPFTWAWIPTTPPPPPAPPQAPPAESVSSARRARIYRWLDEQRVVHFTDNLDAVPEKHRAQARQAAEN